MISSRNIGEQAVLVDLEVIVIGFHTGDDHPNLAVSTFLSIATFLPKRTNGSTMETDFAPDNEIGLLDIAVVLAESWKLILGSALFAGALGFGAATLMPPRHQSEALIRLSPDEVGLLRTSRVLDPVILKGSLLSEFNNSVTAARRAVMQAMSTEQLDGGDIYKITMSGRDPAAVQTFLRDLLKQLITESAPLEEHAELLKQDLLAQEEALSTLRNALSRMGEFLDRGEASEGNSSQSLVGAGETMVALASATEAKRRDIQSTRRALEGSVSEGDIVQSPTLSDDPDKQNRLLIAAAVAAVAGLVTTIFAFMREGWHRSRHDPSMAHKIERIKRSFPR